MILQVIKAFCEHLAHIRRYSVHTVNNYRYDLLASVRFFQKYHGSELRSLEDWGGLSVIDYRACLSERRHRGCSLRSNARLLATWRSFAEFLENDHKVLCPAVRKVQSPKLPSLLPKALSMQHIEQLKALCLKDTTWLGKCHWALLTLLYGAGLRISEALALTQATWPKSFVEGQTSLSIQGKGQRHRYVPLLWPIYQAVQEYQDACPFLEESQALFLNVKGQAYQSRHIQALVRELRQNLLGQGIYATPHSLRHSFASHLLDSGMDIRDIQTLLGHKSLKTTEIYTQVSSAKVLDIYNQVHPLARKNVIANET